MACACIADDFRFDLSYNGCREIYYRDRSKWATGSAFSAPTDYEIAIKVQGGAIHHVLVDANNSTKILPEDLGYNGCFPGGVVEISTESCGTTYTRFAAILCQEECGLTKAIAKLKPDDEGYLKVLKIRDLIDRAKIAVVQQNINQLSKLIHVIRQELRKINCEACGCS